MLRRMGFGPDAERLRRVWEQLYNPRRSHRLPVRLLSTSSQLIPQVVDEIAFQTRRNLAQRALTDIIRFTPEDEQAFKAGARRLQRGEECDLSPRHLVSAASYALTSGKVAPRQLARQVVEQLNTVNESSQPSVRTRSEERLTMAA